MKDNKKIEAAKKLIELMQAYVNGKDIEKLINGNYITITESDSIELICMYNIFKYRIKPKYRPCTKDEFIQLIEQHSDNLIIRNSSTKYTYSIIGIYDTYVVLNKVYGAEIKSFTFKELFDNFIFNNDKDYIIGIKINDEEE